MRRIVMLAIISSFMLGCVQQTPSTLMPPTPSNTPHVVAQATVVPPTTKPPVIPTLKSDDFPTEIISSQPTVLRRKLDNGEILPLLPVQDQYVQVLQDWLDVNPEHIKYLQELIRYWHESNPFYRETMIRPSFFVTADIDNDQSSESYLIVYVGELIRVKLQDQKYVVEKISIDVNDVSWGVMSIWGIQDTNNDGVAEIVLEAQACGSKGCYLALHIVQWVDNDIRDLIDPAKTYDGLDVPRENATWRIITDTHGLQPQFEIIEPQTYSLSYTGSRIIKATYMWNGTYYQLQNIAVIEDRPTPFWALQDGARMIRMGQFARAQDFYHTVLDLDFPDYKGSSFTQVQAKSRAAARTQMLWIGLYLNDENMAQTWYQESQKVDGEFAILSKTLWETYQQTNDLEKACEATRKEAEKIKYPYTDPQPLNLTSVVCVEPEK